MADRSRRGKYARLICRGCRSRKIKCVLPSVHDLGPLNTPQPIDKACERCRNLNLECVVDYTLLGRPQAKRNRLKRSEDRSPNTQTSESVPPEGLEAGGGGPVLSSLDIKDYLFADEGDEILSNGQLPDEQNRKSTRKKEIFQSMIQPYSFFVSVMAKDRAFGADVVHATSSWNTPLPDLISPEMAASFDEYLVWHRFFVPNLPTLASLRERLTSDESSTNCATRLLFALLTVAACEANVNASREERRLKRNLQMAVSFYGQEFMFSPPTHLDSVIVSLYLSDYKPAALATMQGVAHKTIKSEMYINIAYGVFHRLEAVAGEGNQDLGALNSPDYGEFEQCLLNSILGVQMVSNHATVDGPIKKPLQSLRHLASYMKTRVDAYQSALNTRQCSPRAIYHIQWAVSTYILFHSFANAKESMNNPSGFIRIAEEAETNCREQINYTYTLLELCGSQDYDEIAAVRGLVELRFNTVLNWIIALGFLYTSSLGARSEEGRSRRNSDITCEETIQITSQIVKTWNGPLDQTNECFRDYMIRFGIQYTTQLSIMMSKFIECSKMPLNGVEFRPPPRHICLENVTCCKNILENNVIQIKAFGRLHPDFENQIELVKTCAERLANMASSPALSVDAAFAGGCVYAMSSKIIFGFLSLMEKLKNNFSTGKANVDLVDQIIASAEYSGLPGVDSDQISDEGDFWPSVGTFGQLDALSDPFDWASMLEPDYVQQVGFGQEGQDWFNDQFL